MRTLFAFCLLCVVLTACKTEVKEKKEGYTITGEAPGIYNGVRAYLESVDGRGRKIALDTAIIMNEKFSFEGKVEYPKMLNLSINSVQGSVPIILENEDLSIAINKDNLSGSEIKGSKANQALIAYNKKTIELSNKQRELNRALRQVSQRDNVIATDSDASAKALKDVNTKLENYPFQFIDEHKDNVFSLVLLENLLKNNQVDINTIETAFSSLDDDLKNSMQGTMTHTKIKIVKAERDAVGATEIGKIAPAFSAPTPEGQPLALNDIKGKVTLIDFWASWCQPCRRENPNVVKVYEKYPNFFRRNTKW